MSNENLQNIYDPNTAPIRGLRSNWSPGRNLPGSGYYQNIHNLRWANKGEAAVRLGIPTALSSAIGTSGVFRGSVSSVFNGGFGTIFVTVKYSDNTTHIFKSTDKVSWTEITSIAGTQYGNTSLASDGSGHDYPTSFSQVHDDFSGKDIIVFQNGVNLPIVYDGTHTVKNETVTVPEARTQFVSIPNWGGGGNWIAINDPAAWSVANSGANLVGTDVGTAAPNDYMTLSIGAGTTSGDTTTVTKAAGSLAWARSRNINIIIEAPITYIQTMIYGLKLSVITTGVTTVSVYDPTNSAQPQPSVTPIAGWSNGYVLSYFPANDYIGNTGVTDLIWEWVQSVDNPVMVVLNILGMMADVSQYATTRTDVSQGLYQESVAYYNSGSRAESFDVETRIALPMLQDRGVRPTTVSGTGLPTNGARIPFSAQLYYSTDLSYVNTSNAERDKGVDTMRVYRQAFGETTGYLAYSYPIASYSGSWSFKAGAAGETESVNYAGFTANSIINYGVTAPGAFNEPIPIGRSMVAANTRLIVGAKAFDSSGNYLDTFPRVMESRNGNPFRFSEVADPLDPNTAGLCLLTGGSIQAFVSATDIGSASSTVFLFADQAVWAVATHVPASSLALTRIMSVGTNAPNSIIEHLGDIYFVDNSLRVRRLSDGSWISYDVDDKFQGIPAAYRGNIFGMWYQDRLYFAYTPAGQTTNTNILVYSVQAEAWESDDILPSQQAAFMVRWIGESGTYGVSADPQFLYFNSADRKCYRYESGTTDLGAKIAVTLQTGDLHKGYWEGLTIKRCGIFCDPATDSITFNLTFKPDQPGTINGNTLTLSATNDYDWTWAILSTSGTQSASGNAVSVSMTTSLNGGFKIYAIAWEPQETSLEARGQ